MEEETEKLYLQNIEEYVFDEDRIVTYKWLSKALGVHVNTSKQLLFTFANDKSHEKAELQLTYLVGGLLHDGQGCKFQVVPKDNLEKVKAHFKVVTSEHIYSIHKAKQPPNLNILYGVDSLKKDEEQSKIKGSIQYKKCIPRLEAELAGLRLKAQAATVCADGKQWPKGPCPANKINATDKQKSTVDEPAPAAAKSSGAIASMFAAQSKKPKPENAKSKTAETSSMKSKAGTGIGMFFNRQTCKTSSSTVEPKTSPKKDENHDSGIDSQDMLHEASNVDVESSTKECTVEKSLTKNENDKRRKNSKEKPLLKQKGPSNDNESNKNESTLSGSKDVCKSKKVDTKNTRRKHKKSQNDDLPVKKRKRILVVADSDSSEDDMFGRDEEAPESPPPEPEPEPEPVVHTSDAEDIVPSTPQQEAKKGRKRKRKTVDKTFTDEDGYIVTKKEFVYESCSDSEAEEKENENSERNDKNEKNVKIERVEDKSKTVIKTLVKPKINKTAKKEAPKKSNSPQKAKQTTLMSFFRKS